MYVAYERYDVLNRPGVLFKEPRLPENPGVWHVLDPDRTTEGNPWRIRRFGPPPMADRQPVFYGGLGPRAACGTRVKVLTPLIANPEDPDICPKCAEHLRTGTVPFPTGGQCGNSIEVTAQDARRRPDAEDVLNGLVTFQCSKRWDHGGPHRSSSGATWESGPEDFTPEPDGFA